MTVVELAGVGFRLATFTVLRSSQSRTKLKVSSLVREKHNVPKVQVKARC